MERLKDLLKAIYKAGLMDHASGYALDTVQQIVDKGYAIENRWIRDKEMDEVFNQDTRETARVLSNPRNWGISSPEWEAFCKEWK